MQALGERVDPARPRRPVEGQRQVAWAGRSVAGQVRHVGGVREEAGGRPRSRPARAGRCRAALVSHGPRSGELKASAAAQRHERPAGGASRRTRAGRRARRPPRSRRAPTRAQANQSLTASCASIRIRVRYVGAPGGSTSTTTRPSGASSSPARRSSAAGAPPMPMLPSSSSAVRQLPARDVGEHVAGHRVRAAVAGQPHRDRREVDAEPALPAARSAARCRPGPQPMSSTGLAGLEQRRIDRVGGRQPAVERQCAPAGRRRAAPAPAPHRRPPAWRAAGHRARRPGVRPPDGGQAADLVRALTRRSRARRVCGRSGRRRGAGDGEASAYVSTSSSGGSISGRQPERVAAGRAGRRRCRTRSSARRRTRPARAGAGRCPSSRRPGDEPEDGVGADGGAQAGVEQDGGDLRRVHADQERRAAGVARTRSRAAPPARRRAGERRRSRRGSHAPGAPSKQTTRRAAAARGGGGKRVAQGGLGQRGGLTRVGRRDRAGSSPARPPAPWRSR